MPSRIDAVRMLLPLPPKKFRINGTSTIIPKKPYTIEGIPASKLMAGERSLYSPFGQNFAIKTAVSTPIGTPSSTEPAVM